MRGTTPLRGSLRFVLVAFLVWRGTLFALDFVGLHLFPELFNPHKDFSAFQDPPHYFWNSFARWDSGWYARIAERGYYIEGPQSDVAFFPGFPMAARLLGAVLGSHWVAGLVIANVALLGALVFLHRVARRHLDGQASARVVLATLCFPTTFFYSAYYSESLFFFAVCGAFYFYQHDRLLTAALFCALASFTRSSGVLLIPALAVGAVHRWGWRSVWPPGRRTAQLCWLALGAAGLGAFMWMLAMEPRVADPLAWLEAQAGWNRRLTNPVATLWNEAMHWPPGGSLVAGNASAVLQLLDWAAALLLIASGAYALLRIDAAHGTFALLVVFASLASGRSLSMARFALTVPALFLSIGALTTRPAVERIWFAASSMLAALITVAFATWRLAG